MTISEATTFLFRLEEHESLMRATMKEILDHAQSYRRTVSWEPEDIECVGHFVLRRRFKLEPELAATVDRLKEKWGHG